MLLQIWQQFASKHSDNYTVIGMFDSTEKVREIPISYRKSIMPPRIGTLAEKSLHAALKARYARPDDRLEYRLNGYVIDIFRCAGELSLGCQCIEIQTRSLAS